MNSTIAAFIGGLALGATGTMVVKTDSDQPENDEEKAVKGVKVE